MEIKRKEFKKIADEVMDENALKLAMSIKEDVPLLKIPDVLLVEMYMWKFLLCEIEKKLFDKKEGDEDGGNDNPKKS